MFRVKEKLNGAKHFHYQHILKGKKEFEKSYMSILTSFFLQFQHNKNEFTFDR